MQVGMASNGKILSKAPCNDDLFKGGAHKKLAKVIAEEILNDQDCSIIGIDGGWGSGKSNLVGMVEKELTDASKLELLGKYHSSHTMHGGIRMTIHEDLSWRN